MKKLATLISIALTVFAFTACGDYTNTKDSHETTDSHDTTTTSVNTGDTNTSVSKEVTAQVDLNCTSIEEGTVTFKATLGSEGDMGNITSASTSGTIVGTELVTQEDQYTYTGIIDSVTSVPTLTIYVDNVQVTDGTCK